MRDEEHEAILQPTQSISEHRRSLVLDGDDGRESNDARGARADEDRRVAQTFSLEHLVEARASIAVIANLVMMDAQDHGGSQETTPTMLQRLARAVDSQWNLSLPTANGSREVNDDADDADHDDDCGAASRRYLRRMVEKIVNDHEAMRANNDSPVEDGSSGNLDELYEVWATMVACPWKNTVSVRASSTMTFHIPNEFVSNHGVSSTQSLSAMHTVEDHRDQDLTLRFRTYPYHNDVSLRLWEAGTVVAELLVSNCDISKLVWGQRVVELGSGGIGLTGVVALCCAKAAHYTFTDCSTLAILNLRHIMEMNRHALNASMWECLCYDWNDAVHYNGGHEVEAALPSSERVGGPGPATCSPVSHISTATVLLAADVAYDDEPIPGLVETFRMFFTSGSAGAPAEALDPGARDDTRVGSNNDVQSGRCGNIDRSHSIGAGRVDSDNISASHKDKVAILAVTRRKQSTFDALMRRLRSRLLEDRSGRVAVELELVLGPSDGNSTNACGCPQRQPPPVLFPTHFVQPRSDVAVFLLRSNSSRSK